MTRGIGGADRGTPHTDTFAWYTDAAKGDLVKQDTSGNHKVALCVEGDDVFGRVEYVSLNPDTTKKAITVALPGDRNVFNLPYTGVLALGNSVQQSATKGAVKGTATDNGSRVVAVDVPVAGYADVMFPHIR